MNMFNVHANLYKSVLIPVSLVCFVVCVCLFFVCLSNVTQSGAACSVAFGIDDNTG